VFSVAVQSVLRAHKGNLLVSKQNIEFELPSVAQAPAAAQWGSEYDPALWAMSSLADSSYDGSVGTAAATELSDSINGGMAAIA
jgi:hypothetical protein